MELTTLTNSNEWWVTGQVNPIFLEQRQRPLFAQIKKYLRTRQMLLIYGLRRVGKTTLFYQLIQHLLKNAVNPFNLLYFSFDEKVASIKEILTVYQEKVLKKELVKTEAIYFFLDEIQKLENWQNEVKILYDLYPSLKIFLSGSASVLLQKKSKESLGGRLYDFFLKPLDFSEFLAWKGITFDAGSLELYQNKIIPLFSDYLRKGGFPEIIHEEDDELIRNYIKNTVLEKIVYRDLPLEFGLKDIELLRLLIEMVVVEPGFIVNYDKLAQNLGRSKITIINYIEYLKYALLIRELKNLRPGFLVSSRKGKKLYPTTSAFCFALREDFYQERFLQKVAELMVVNFLDAQYYFRNAFEVDVVLKRAREILPIEVKYGEIEEKGIRRFLDKFGLEKGILVSKDVELKKDQLKITPLWRFLLEGI